MSGETGGHEHHVGCAFGSPDCPAFGEVEPPRPPFWRRLLARALPPGGGLTG